MNLYVTGVRLRRGRLRTSTAGEGGIEVTDGLARPRGNTGATRMHKALGYSSSTTKMDVETHSYYPSIPEVEAGRAGVQGHLWLYSEFEASLSFMRSSLRKQIVGSPPELSILISRA